MGRPPCCDEAEVKKGPWTAEEDQKLKDYIQEHGHGIWRSLPALAGLNRCAKSCRLRWTNYLRPNIKRGKFSEEEEETIIRLHSKLGNKWSAIANHLEGRTDNEIKNYWNTHLRKKLLRKGVDPITHNPRPDLAFIASLNSLLQGNPAGTADPALAGINIITSADVDTAIKLQADISQLAKIQLAQTLLQLLTTPASPTIDVISLMSSGLLPGNIHSQSLLINSSSSSNNNQFLGGSGLYPLPNQSAPPSLWGRSPSPSYSFINNEDKTPESCGSFSSIINDYAFENTTGGGCTNVDRVPSPYTNNSTTTYSTPSSSLSPSAEIATPTNDQWQEPHIIHNVFQTWDEGLCLDDLISCGIYDQEFASTWP